MSLANQTGPKTLKKSIMASMRLRKNANNIQLIWERMETKFDLKEWVKYYKKV